ncbi:hypothetical protein HQ619_18510, partial [Burkholderia gladioli]|nr:hypothetical protein [Burkholderia gladioli]
MTTNTETGVRRAAVHDLAPGAVARGQNFYVQWLEGETREFEATSAHEMLVLLPEDGAEIAVGDGPAQRVPGRSVCVLPAGRARVSP